MANTHISPPTKARLLRYCEADELNVTQGIDSLLSKVAALEKTNEWLSKLVAMHEAEEDKQMEQ